MSPPKKGVLVKIVDKMFPARAQRIEAEEKLREKEREADEAHGRLVAKTQELGEEAEAVLAEIRAQDAKEAAARYAAESKGKKEGGK